MAIRKTGGAVAILALLTVVEGCASDASEPSSGASAPLSGAPSTPHPFAGEESWIAYQTFRGDSEGVWLVHPDGTDDHEIGVDIPGERLHPDWSPDGRRLVVTSRMDRDVLYLVDAAGHAAEILFPCAEDCVGDDEAVWSPDGARIAFVRAMEPFVDDAPTCALFIGDVDDRSVEQVGEARRCWDRETFPHWSHDGSRLAYYRGVYEGDETLSTALYVFDVEGRQETKLTDDELFAGDSDWSSEDEWIVFSTFPLNDFQCCQVSVVGVGIGIGISVIRGPGSVGSGLDLPRLAAALEGRWVSTEITPNEWVDGLIALGHERDDIELALANFPSYERARWRLNFIDDHLQIFASFDGGPFVGMSGGLYELLPDGSIVYDDIGCFMTIPVAVDEPRLLLEPMTTESCDADERLNNDGYFQLVEYERLTPPDEQGQRPGRRRSPRRPRPTSLQGGSGPRGDVMR